MRCQFVIRVVRNVNNLLIFMRNGFENKITNVYEIDETVPYNNIRKLCRYYGAYHTSTSIVHAYLFCLLFGFIGRSISILHNVVLGLNGSTYSKAWTTG